MANAWFMVAQIFFGALSFGSNDIFLFRGSSAPFCTSNLLLCLELYYVCALTFQNLLYEYV